MTTGNSKPFLRLYHLGKKNNNQVQRDHHISQWFKVPTQPQPQTVPLSLSIQTLKTALKKQQLPNPKTLMLILLLFSIPIPAT